MCYYPSHLHSDISDIVVCDLKLCSSSFVHLLVFFLFHAQNLSGQ